MTTQPSTKVRLVRCPRCRQVLAELPEVPLYKCGGCGTILQAKSRKLETNGTELSSQETDAVEKSRQDNVLEEKGARSSSHDLSKVESLPEKDSIRCRDDHGDCRVELREDRSISNGHSSSSEVTSLRTEDSHVEAKESLKEDNPLGQNSQRYNSKVHDDTGERNGGRNSSNDFPTSGELTREAEAYSPEVSEHLEQQNKNNLDQVNRVDKMEGGESQSSWQEGDNFVGESQNLPDHEDQGSASPPDCEHGEGTKDNYVEPANDENNQICFADQNGDLYGGLLHAGVDLSSEAVVSHGNENISQSAEQSVEVDDSGEGLPIRRSRNDSVVASESPPLNESLVSFYLTSPDDEHLDHSMGEVARNFGRISSIDTLGSSAHADLSAELNFKYGSMTNYPTTSGYYAYDGSESSNDGTDDQTYEHISHPSAKRTDVDYISSREMLGKERFRASSEQERTHWATSSSNHAMRNSHWSAEKSTETGRYTSGNRMRLDKQGGVSSFPFTSSSDYRTASPASYRHNLLPPRPGFNSSDKPSYSELEDMDLLRTVRELKDQLNRMRFSKVTTDRRFPAGVMDGESTPFHYDHLAPEREIYADLRRPGSRYNPRSNQASGCGEQCHVSRPAFSGDAAHYRYQVSCSCLHRCPHDWHYSAQLPSDSMHCKNGHRAVHTDHNRCNISSSPSPQHYTSSELSLWGCETKSDNQRHDEIRRLKLKEKYQTAKRHLRPIAGGAPVVACYHCAELLQLPADFLLFTKRYHRLMCNACQKILKFSLEKGTHIVPYLPDAYAPPPSEADDYNDATSRRKQEPLSHSSSGQHVGHVSYSDDYGPSCSTEGEASVILPSHAQVGRNSYNRKMSSSGSYEPTEDRKMKSVLREPQKKNKSSLETDESVGPSLLQTVEPVGPSSRLPKGRKATSEIEELQPLPNSPLHRLMGYSSPSQVLNK